MVLKFQFFLSILVLELFLCKDDNVLWTCSNPCWTYNTTILFWMIWVSNNLCK
ncbi:hypothetical protein GLYMA_12G036450v4 [Glycine max]|nr:hypothetical protein GLYMA_12G036450v4 [Glycine max]KAG4967005.1 hypothetical protein JHK87_032656 [Glycine soja]KAG4985116.1 hypothetical protein JHK86_032807 [Glycine max]KAG5139282.1 hypothetical protein JHK84_033050 [Glycine max]KAH1141424.1 hypothetical protein GYH30_032604 [Glycine max]